MIEIKCKGTHWLKLQDIHILQDNENFCLKELSKKSFDKLSKSLLRYGFQFPFFVWYCQEENIYYTVDGTQRLKVLSALEKSGNEMPEKFPCVEIDAKDKKEAARTILLQSSSYGKMTQESYDAFSENFDLCGVDLCECLDLGVITFEDIDLGEGKNRKEERKSGAHSSGGYNDDGEPEPCWLKILHRIELVANLTEKKSCLELFAGRGQLGWWYERLFCETTRVDKQNFDGIDFVCDASNFINERMDREYDFVDFDDEGCPFRELVAFWAKAKLWKKESFGIAITDGMGLNLKSRGKINLFETYRQGEDKVIQATEEMYKNFDSIFDLGMERLAAEGGYRLEKKSLYRKENGNVLYGCYIAHKIS